MFIKHWKRSILLVVLLNLFAEFTNAQQAVSPPNYISYQGRIALKDNSPIPDGQYSVAVTFWSDSIGNIKLWSDSFQAAIHGGTFNLMLGTQNPLPSPAKLDKPIWISASINGSECARTLLSSVPLSLNVADGAITKNKIADNAITTEKLADASVTYSKLADSSITPEKLNLEYVGSISINGQKITAKGSGINIVGGNGVDITYDNAANNLVLSSTSNVNNGPNKGANPQWVATGGVGLGAGCPGTPNTDGGNGTNTVSGGCSNNATATLGYATIGGGQQNKATNTWATVGGGDTNFASGEYSTVAGGYFNKASAVRGAIGGGENNSVYYPGSVIAGGDSNVIGTSGGLGYASHQGFIGGGIHNSILDNADNEQAQSAIAGGLNNTILEGPSFIGGGEANLVTQEWAGIVAGKFNVDSADFGFIGGGEDNEIIDADMGVRGLSDTTFGSSAIVGGAQNTIRADLNFIGGGYTNQISSGNYSAVDGGRHNVVSNSLNSISGGDSNTISSNHGSIGGGRYNSIQSSFSAIAGGDSNQISSDHASIGGGRYNKIQGPYGTIAGGKNNFIQSGIGTVMFNTIGGGLQNTIEYGDTSTIGGGYSNEIFLHEAGTIAGGEHNFVGGLTEVSGYGFVGGGYDNQVLDGFSSSIVGGDSNYASGDQNAVGGGRHNSTLSYYSNIGGGDTNYIVSFPYSTIAGGERNHIFQPDTVIGDHAVIGGGLTNTVQSGLSTIAGGDSNTLEEFSQYSVISGGRQNRIQGPWSVISGGDSNSILAKESDHNFIGGGQGNVEDNPSFGAIAGGLDNYLGFGAWSSGIAGGAFDSILCQIGFIGSGRYNVIYGLSNYCSGIASGESNHVQSSLAFIGGGQQNVIDASDGYATVGGGKGNWIKSSNAPYSTIPGGDSLVANSFAQTVIGYKNVLSGTVAQGTKHKWSTTNTVVEEPLFIIGNGDPTAVSNAFEVSYDGHSTVTDLLGNAAGRQAKFGATYQDNIVYAWGDIGATGGVPVAGFGVQGSVIHAGPGTYVVTLSNTNTNFTNASVTVTIRHNDTTNVNNVVLLKPGTSLDGWCGWADATEIGIFTVPNTFVIHTYPLGSCDPADRPFFFKVCGR